MTALERAIRQPAPVRGFGARSPLDGLERRSLGFSDVFAQSVAAVAPTAAATTVVLLVAGLSPTAALTSLLVAGAVSVLVAQTVGQFARRFASAGALYTYVARGLGTGAGLATGVAAVIGYAAIAMFALLGGASYLVLLLGPIVPPGPLGIAAVLLGEALVLGVVLVRGIRLSSRIALIVELLSVALIVALLTALLVRIGPVDPAALLPAGSDSPLTIAAGALIALTAFVGFESAATLGVEARTPLRTVPRAMAGTVVVATGLYALAAATQVAGFHALGADLAASASPVNELADAYGLGPWALLADLGIAASFLACAIGSMTALTRVLFTMGREGVLPRATGRAHRRHGTPVVAVGLTLPVVVGAPLALVAGGVGLRDAMHLTVVIGGFGYIASYVLVCAAAPVFLRRIGELTARAALTAIACALALASAAIAFAVVDVSSGSPAVWVAAVLAVAASVAVIWRIRRAPVGPLGTYDVPTASAVLGGVAREGTPADGRNGDG
ncbi:MAG: APC family permease [Microbacterium arborescens]